MNQQLAWLNSAKNCLFLTRNASRKGNAELIIVRSSFSESARRWTQGEPIVLAEEREINRLVESAYGGD
jgi:hypothetical protein